MTEDLQLSNILGLWGHGDLLFLKEMYHDPWIIDSHHSQVIRKGIIITPSSASRPGLTLRGLAILSQRGPGWKDHGSGQVFRERLAEPFESQENQQPS